MKIALSLLFMVMAIVYFNLPTTESVVAKSVDGTVLINNIVPDGVGTGTGFIIDDNVIITNQHVINVKGEVSVYSKISNRKYEAQVVYKDPVSDIAILRLKDWDLFVKESNPVKLSFGDSDATKVGDKIIVIGHPSGLLWSVSEGIIAAKNRRMGPNPKFLDQIDANLFQGNSGGPIFNEYGQVVCVSNMMLQITGGSYGFCIPSNLVKKVLHDINTLGEVRWRALNASFSLTSERNSVTIDKVEPEGAAAKAGILPGDVIKMIGNKEILMPDDLLTELAVLNGNHVTVPVTIIRAGKEIELNVNTGFRTSKEFKTELQTE